MLKAFRGQIPLAVLLANANRARLGGDFADVRNRNAINSLWQARSVLRRDCEEQFEVFTAVQCQRERIERASPAELNNIFIERK